MTKWCSVPNPPGYTEPEWKRSAAIDNDGTVFIPAMIAGREKAVTTAAAWEGIPALIDSGHVYLPAKWIGKEYPVTADVCEKIITQVKRYFSEAQR